MNIGINKIRANVERSAQRYLRKNTVYGQYQRHCAKTQIGVLASGAQILRMAQWGIADVGIFTGFSTFALTSAQRMLKSFKQLRPIKQRAASIRKAARLSK